MERPGLALGYIGLGSRRWRGRKSGGQEGRGRHRSDADEERGDNREEVELKRQHLCVTEGGR